MPGFYEEDEYDLAGFSVGVVEKKEIIDGSTIKEGDAIIGIASSGLHSNGYSLARKVFFEKKGLKIDSHVPELKVTAGAELIKPTRIYVKAFQAIKDKVRIKGMAHITGGGIPGNLTRIFNKKLTAVIREGSWPVPTVFELIQKWGGVPETDMKKTFNMGIGYVIVLGRKSVTPAMDVLNEAGYPAYLIGFIEKGGKDKIRYV